jgi:hypothetical protein
VSRFSKKCENLDVSQPYGPSRSVTRIAVPFSFFFLEADSSYALAKSVSVLDAVNWIAWAVKKIKAETVKRCFAIAEFGESNVADNLKEASKNIAAISNLCRGKDLFCDTNNFVWSDDHLATHYSFESATALLKGKSKVIPI